MKRSAPTALRLWLKASEKDHPPAQYAAGLYFFDCRVIADIEVGRPGGERPRLNLWRKQVEELEVQLQPAKDTMDKLLRKMEKLEARAEDQSVSHDQQVQATEKLDQLRRVFMACAAEASAD